METTTNREGKMTATTNPQLTTIGAKSDYYTIRNGEVVQANETTPTEHLFRTREHAAKCLAR